jgi:hypothetical protein
MLRREPDTGAFRSGLARELATVSPRPGGWERVRASLVTPAAAPRTRRAARRLPAVPLVVVALFAGLAAVAVAGVLATRPAPGQRVEAPIVPVCGALAAIATPISLAEARRRASFPVLAEAGAAPASVDWMTFDARDSGCAPQARLVYGTGDSSVVVRESAARPAALAAGPQVETASAGGKRLAVRYADRNRTRVAAVLWAADRTQGSAVFGAPVSRRAAVDFVARLA